MKKLSKILLSLTLVLFSFSNSYCFGKNATKSSATTISKKNDSKFKAKPKPTAKTKNQKKKIEPMEYKIQKLNDSETKVDITMYVSHAEQDKNKTDSGKVEICNEQGQEILNFSKKVSQVKIDGKIYVKVEISYIIKIKSEDKNAKKFVWPVPGYDTITYGFNDGKEKSRHGAIDIAGAEIYGSEVVASCSGKVTIVNTEGWGGGYGKHVVIDHGDGEATLYGHMSDVNVKAGETVLTGQKIGEVGSTGFATGPHLHFEYRINGVRTNPANILDIPKNSNFM